MSTRNIEEIFEELVYETDDNARKLLDFRLNGGVLRLVEKLRGTCREEPIILKFLGILKKLCEDADFSYDFCQLGGQAYLKSCSCLSYAVQELAEDVIATIIHSGYIFPSPIDVFEPHLKQPKMIQFKSKISKSENETIELYLRSVGKSMHGVGQFGVGYVLWSSSIILSRLFGSIIYKCDLYVI